MDIIHMMPDELQRKQKLYIGTASFIETIRPLVCHIPYIPSVHSILERD